MDGEFVHLLLRDGVWVHTLFNPHQFALENARLTELYSDLG